MPPKLKVDIPVTAPADHPNLFVGTSGWAYPSWKPGFYPADLSAKRFLSYYASAMNSVEVNYTFRATPSEATLHTWLAETPADFQFSFKAPQQITHFSRLRQCEAAVEAFFDVLSPVRKAGKLGPGLVSASSYSKSRPCPAGGFPRDAGLEWAWPGSNRLRVPSRILVFTRGLCVSSQEQSRLCVAESDDLATPEIHPAKGLACFRLRRNGGYTRAEIDAFAVRLMALAKTHKVYAYFKHEAAPTGALHAVDLLAFLKAGEPA